MFMNKIKVIDNDIDLNINEDIKVDVCSNKITIDVINDTDLEIEYNNLKSDNDINIHVSENKILNLFELKQSNSVNANYNYVLDRNSVLNVVKFYDCNDVIESDTVDLNGEYSSVNYTLKTISNEKQIYNLRLNHNAKNTISNVTNSGVNINGSIDFNVTGYVPNGCKDCELNQSNRIVTFNNNLCKIDPILLIDENDVVANHAALIGKFNEDELFYLNSRGISYDDAITLLVKGFLLDNLKDERLDKIIEKYWR